MHKNFDQMSGLELAEALVKSYRNPEGSLEEIGRRRGEIRAEIQKRDEEVVAILEKIKETAALLGIK